MADMSISSEVREKYKDYLDRHIQSVWQVARELGVPHSQYARHDLSKWDEEEFVPYARHFYGGGCPDEFAVAWLRHIHRNPHHWNHWIFPTCYEPKGASIKCGMVEMPKEYALEMIADWVGAEMAQSGQRDISKWLSRSVGRIILHPKTDNFVCSVLSDLGYKDIISQNNFGSDWVPGHYTGDVT